MPSPILVAAAIVRQDNAVLIAQRRAADSFPLRWEFPGGKVEPGERPEEALVRECREELGIRVRVGKIFEVIYHQYPEFSVLILFYECDVVSGDPRALGCRQVRFAAPNDLAALDFLPADRALINRLRLSWPD